jgi:organic radical activating enzyme
MIPFNVDEDVGRRDYVDLLYNQLRVTKIFKTIQGEGPFAGRVAVFVRLSGCNLGSKRSCPWCLPGYYKVQTRTGGTKRIDAIKIGDELLTLDDDLKPVFTTVKATKRRLLPISAMVKITYKDNNWTRSLIVSSDHPFHVKGRGFVPAKDLQADDLIYRIANGVRVISVKPAPKCSLAKGGAIVNGLVEVFNFSCSPFNTFCVRGLHTHNCDSDFVFSKGKIRSVDEILTEAADLMGDTSWWLLVLTGGEPLLQTNVSCFLTHAFQAGWAVQIETNGYFWSPELTRLAQQTALTVVVSPKVNLRGEFPPLAKGLMDVANCLKCVVEDNSASPYYSLPSYIYEFKERLGKVVYVSPIASYARQPKPNEEIVSIWPPTPLDLEQTRKNYQYAAKLVMEHDLVLSTQQHLAAAME